jgi:uncharacterized protein YcbK (DUF882 family)
MPGFAQAGPAGQAGDVSEDSLIETASTGQTASAEISQGGELQVSATETVMGEGDAELPAEVAFLPVTKPGTEGMAAQTAIGAEAQGSQQAAVIEDGAAQQQVAAAPAPTPAPELAQAGQGKPSEAASQPALDNPVYAIAGEPPKAESLAPKKKSFLSAFFGTSPASAAPSPVRAQKPKPIVQLASAEPAKKPVVMASLGNNLASDNALPGVRQTALFEIKRKSGIDDDSDVDLHEEDDGTYEVASAAGLARLAPNGLLKQTDKVDLSCLKPSLVRVLKVVEQHYGQKMVVTSGYRDASRNRRARGAKNSLHMYCAAADVQIPGVSKWELANYVRSMPGRGGVGTYCHTNSVHIDVGPERDWNWRCRRRK